MEDTVAVGAGARALASEESAVGLHGTEGESKAGVDEEGGRNWEGTGDSDEDKDTIREVSGINTNVGPPRVPSLEARRHHAVPYFSRMVTASVI